MSRKEAPTPDTAGACARHGRFWAVTDPAGQLVCLAVYKKGAKEVLRRLGLAETSAATPMKKTRMKKTRMTQVRTRQKGQRR